MTVQFDDRGLVPAIAQEARTGRVLMLAWMNAEALRRTKETGQAWYYSRSRARLWRKGESSGHTQTVLELRHDCDADTILLLVEQTGPACHTNQPSCFFYDHDLAETKPPPSGMLDRLTRVIEARKTASGDASYTARLLSAGVPKITAKIAEEAGELCEALSAESDDRVVSEAADVLYHLLVGLSARELDIEAVLHELARRFGTSGLVEKASRNYDAPAASQDEGDQ